MMINRIKNNIKKQYIIVFMLGVVLSIIYGSKINNVNTVWELGDEAGYLCNVAYMAGTDYYLNTHFFSIKNWNRVNSWSDFY